MDLPNNRGFTLNNLSKANVILGKNGCGKSHFLKELDIGLKGGFEYIGRVRYVSPERGGTLQYEPSIDQAMSQNLGWLDQNRRSNQSTNFREQSAALFRRLELLVLREIERNHHLPDYQPGSFDGTLATLNKLLDRVELKRDDQRAFVIVNRATGDEADPKTISSGESELVSLGIEFLAFAKECLPDKTNILLVDEPDVHLHPDLQDRLADFIASILEDAPFRVIIATHSTALLAGLANRTQTNVAFMRRGDTALTLKPVSETDKRILPIFGAHPLSNVFNQAPVLLVEGEDDERVWQQAIRSGAGKVRVFPCSVDGLPNFADFETETNSILESVYDAARGFSLRDRDQNPEIIDDLGRILRMRLSCRAAENLMLTNEALALAGTNWAALQEKVNSWIAAMGFHQYHAEVEAFADAGFDRKGHDLKMIRNILIGLISTKPWEVLVGQTIGQLAQHGGAADEGSIREYLGERVCQQVLGLR